MASSNYSRIVAVLNAFGSDNAPLRVSSVLEHAGIRPSSGYGLIRAMAQFGLLERVDHGLICLGPAARQLAFSPIESGYARVGQTTYVSFDARPSRSDADEPVNLKLGWKPMLAEAVATERFAQPPPFKIGFANASLNNPWRHALLRSMQYAIRLHGDSIGGFDIRNAEDDPARQLRDIDELLGAGINGLVISAADVHDEALAMRLCQLVADGIPVIAVDRRPSAPDSFVSFVTASDAHIGHLSALWLAEHIGEAGRIWMLSGADRASPALRRQSAALSVFSRFPDIDIEAVVFTGWTEEGGREAIEALNAQFDTPPDGVWCDSGLQGVGSIEAFVEAGKPPPPHTGGDLNRMYKLAIKHRVPFAALDYPAAMGARAIETVLDTLSGARVMKRIETPIQTILPRGTETSSIKADQWAESHVRWDRADDDVLSQGPSLDRPASLHNDAADARGTVE